MKFRVPGATAIAAVLVAIAAPAPLAFAQNSGQPPPVTRQIQQPLNEARNAIIAKDWATAETKLAAATAGAKTPVDRAAIDRLAIVAASEQKDGPKQVAIINSLLASGQLTPDETKQYKGFLAKAYLDAGDQTASLNAYSTFLNEYGGSPDQFISLANDFSKLNDHAKASTFAKKAIDGKRAAGEKPHESWLQLLARSYNLGGQMGEYYATREVQLIDYPAGTNAKNYWKELIARAQNEPNFGFATRLDMFRLLEAVDVSLTANERSIGADEALKRGLPNEALTLLEEANTAGELTSEFDKNNYATAKSQAKSDQAALTKETTDVLAKGTGSTIAKIGEAHLSYGDNAKAIEVLQAGIAKGIPDANEMALAKLHLGIAQFRAGQADAARASWADAKSDNGTTILAHYWTLLSKVKA